MKLRILELPPLWEAVPPKGYGAIEYLTASLVDELVARKHEVTTYASGDSDLAGNLIAITPTALNHCAYQDVEVLRMRQFLLALKDSKKYDIVHCHLHSNTGWLGLPLLAPIAEKTIFSIHTFATEENRKLLSTFPNCNFVATSAGHYRSYNLPFINRFVHHGIRVDDFKFYPQAIEPKYLAFLGRLRPEKGVHLAIQIAKKLGMPLKIAGIVKPEDRQYFNECISPNIKDGEVDFVGELGFQDKISFMGNATALINPTQIDEPFGLVVIEAMACGTPVIATDKGAMPEIITHGKTGIILNANNFSSINLAQLEGLDRADIRKDTEKRFSFRNMTDGYEKIFSEIVGQNIALKQNVRVRKLSNAQLESAL